MHTAPIAEVHAVLKGFNASTTSAKRHATMAEPGASTPRTNAAKQKVHDIARRCATRDVRERGTMHAAVSVVVVGSIVRAGAGLLTFYHQGLQEVCDCSGTSAFRPHGLASA